MKCDLCGIVSNNNIASSCEAVGGSPLCKSCYEMVTGEHEKGIDDSAAIDSPETPEQTVNNCGQAGSLSAKARLGSTETRGGSMWFLGVVVGKGDTASYG